MKKIVTALSLICFVFSFQAKASHIAGGDLSYVCLGGNQYQINLNLFVDCLGFDPGATQPVSFTSTCGGIASTTVNVTNPGGSEISQLCPAQINNSTCNGGTLPGMWVFNYTGTVTLSPCDTWTMSWDLCCRNAAILNLVNPDLFGSYIEATLNSVTSTCNSSPAFTAQPIPYVCANQPVNYSYGVVETDGDSLRYSFIGAMDAAGVLLTYSPGYSATSPLPGIVVNSTTGMLSFTPTTLGNFVVVVLVEEYNSSGQLIGTVMRDIQFIVQSCSNIVPDAIGGTITGMSGSAVQTGPFSLEMCEGSNFTFNASFTDSNPGDSLAVSSNISTVLPGSTITTSGSNPVVATISWIAPGGSANTNTTFSVTINDGACPVPGQQTFVYDIQVQPRTLTGPDQIICGTQSAPLFVTGGSTFSWVVISGPAMVVGTNFSCDLCDNPIASPTATSIYEVTSNLSGTCVNKDTIVVTVVPDYTFSTTQSNTITCLLDSIQFNTSVSLAGAFGYSWSPSTFLNNATIQDPIATISVPGTYSYILALTSPQGCVKRDTTVVTITPSYRPDAILTAVPSPVCINDTVQLSASFATSVPATCGINPVGCAASLSASIGTASGANTNTSYPAIYGNYYTSSKHQMLFRASELNAAGITGGKIDQIDIPVNSISGIATYHQFTIKMGCTNLNALGTTWVGGLFQVYNPATVNISVGMNTYLLNNAFEWDGISNIVVEICSTEGPPYSNFTNNSISPFSTTTFTSCLSSRTDLFDMCPDLTNMITQFTSRPVLRFHYCSPPSPASFTYSWFPLGAIFTPTPTPTTPNTGAAVPVNTTYSVIVTEIASGCIDTAYTSVTTLPHTTIVVSAGNDVTICPGTPTTLTATGATDYSWSPATALSSATIANPVASPMTTTTYTVVGTTQCAPPSIDSITVNAVNSVIITLDAGNNTTICPGTPTTLNATGATNYSWSPGTALSNTSIANPVASPMTTTTYTVIGTAACANPVIDSVTVSAVNSVVITVGAGSDATICPGTTTVLNATGATNYLWSPGVTLSSTTIANPVASPITTITYTVTGTTPCADPDTDSVTVNVLNAAQLNIAAGPDGAICVGEPLNLSASTTGGFSGNLYDWFVVAGVLTDTIHNPHTLNNAFVVATQEGTNMYEITVTDLCGNTASDTVIIDVTNDCQLIIPNVFTPNGDGNNDVFLVAGNGIKSFSIAIFNRWGKKVFESKDISQSWNGSGNIDGTYYYVLKAETNNSKEVNQQGYIQLLSN